jgi:hypothetical protein
MVEENINRREENDGGREEEQRRRKRGRGKFLKSKGRVSL